MNEREFYKSFNEFIKSEYKKQDIKLKQWCSEKEYEYIPKIDGNIENEKSMQNISFKISSPVFLRKITFYFLNDKLLKEIKMYENDYPGHIKQDQKDLIIPFLNRFLYIEITEVDFEIETKYIHNLIEREVNSFKNNLDFQ